MSLAVGKYLTIADVLRFLSNVTGENYTIFEMNGEMVDEIIKTIYDPVEKAYWEKYHAARAIVLAEKEAKSKAFREEWHKKRELNMLANKMELI